MSVSTKAASQWWIEASRSNPAQFVRFMTDGAAMPASHHIEWMWDILSPGSNRINIIAFPGSGKTMTMLYSLAWLIGKRPWLTNIICSASEAQATERLKAVKELILLNERFEMVFPHIHLDTFGIKSNTTNVFNIWSDRHPDTGELIDYQQWRTYCSKYGELKDSTIFAGGITSSQIPGKRINGLIIIDDPHDLKNSATEAQRYKVYAFVKTTLLTRLVPTSKYAKCALICTRWAESDLSGRLSEEVKRKDGEPVWTTKVFPIETEFGEPTWPEVWGEEEIEYRADGMGGKESQLWKLLFMNDSLGLASGEFSLDMLQVALPVKLPKMRDVYITSDFASTDGLKSDFTVFTHMGRDFEEHYNVYVFDIKRIKKSKISDKVDDLIAFYDRSNRINKVTTILFEDADCDAEVQALNQKRPDIKTIRVKTKGNKADRLEHFAERCQTSSAYFNLVMEEYYNMCTELLGFPRVAHDDICDTLSLPFELEDWATGREEAGLVYIDHEAIDDPEYPMIII